MTTRSRTRKLFTRAIARSIRQAPIRARIRLETLEAREVPATFTVLNTNDTGAGSLRDAVASANANIGADAIVFGDGSGTGGANFLDGTPETVTLTSGAITFTGDTNLTTVTGPGANLLSVSGGGTQQVFWVNAGISTSISDLTITDGHTGAKGGGVHNEGTLTLTDCTISGSSADDQGGALANYPSATATLTNCLITGNTAGFQGAGLQNTGTMTVTNCVISVNTGAPSGGGGINTQGPTLILVDTTLTGNTSGGAGGGLAANNTVTLTRCTISGNTAAFGGGILEYVSTMTLTSCTISGNIATSSGGGVYMRFGSLDVRNGTISSNSAPAGGGISNTSGTGVLTIQNTITSANTAPTGPDIDGSIDNDNGHNLFGTALSGATGTGNVFSDAPLLAPLADYGGPTKTRIPQAGSPAIGSGDNTGGPASDQRGFTRPVGSGGNIGAVEGIAYTVTNTSDSGAGSLRQAVLDTNTAFSADVVLFSTLFNSPQLITLAGVELDLTDTATTMIIGPGANVLSINGNNLSRIFLVSGNASLSGMTITGGQDGLGGGIRNDGTLAAAYLAFSSNLGDFGGGFCNTGIATVTNSLFNSNSSVNEGGGFENYGTLTVTNSTVTANTSVRGGGIANAGGGTLTIINSTVNANSASTSGGGMENIGGTVALKNTIVAGQTAGGDIAGTVSGSNNLIGTGGSGGLVNGVNGNLVGVSSPGLGALTSNGGPIQTIALLPSSPAINAGNFANAPADDQRGLARFGGTDIGAFEYQFKVTNTTDSSLGSLRQAITNANAVVGTTDTVIFRLGTGVQTIAPTSSLPTITDTTTIDGTTQPGWVSAPIIEIRGDSAGAGVTGLSITANNSTIRGLVINRFGGSGILISGGTGNIVEGSYIGTNTTGLVALPNSAGGISIAAADSTIIGGTAASAGNVIGGNTSFGIKLDFATGTTIQGNTIGLGADGSTLVGNSAEGVWVTLSATGNTVGGTIAGSGNVISGNATAGVRITGSGTNANFVLGNLIGTDRTGLLDRGNAGPGVYVAVGDNNVIGGTTTGAGNVISGNAGSGIEIAVASTGGTIIRGNTIGLGLDGSTLLGNDINGIFLQGSDGTLIGGDDATDGSTDGLVNARNIISGNTQYGIQVIGEGATRATNNVIAGNYIGTNRAGTADKGNTLAGIGFTDRASDNTIGGSTAGAGNRISGNDGSGVLFASTNVFTNTVAGNYIGTNATGTAALANSVNGVLITAGAHDNTIGGLTATPGSGAGNVISGNTTRGIFLDITAGANTIIQGNIIGLDAAGAVDISGGDGIHVNAGTNTLIGGTNALARNIISGQVTGVNLSTSGSNYGIAVQGNYIGTDITGTLARPNSTGVAVGNAPGTTVGGTAAGAGNVISGNATGISVTLNSATIAGNLIGTDPTGTSPLANTTGVLLSSSAHNVTIGGTTAAARNIISGNSGIGQKGVFITGVGVTSNVVQGNYIGTDVAGTGDLGNDIGVQIANGANGNTIGGPTAGAGNLIAGGFGAGNLGAGVDLRGTGTSNNLVEGNTIGLDATGTILANSIGVYLSQGATNNTIGGTAAGARNIISGNSTGVRMDNATTTGNVVAGNYIGTDSAGSVARANTVGVSLQASASNNTIGGTTTAERNVISGNAGVGVYLLGSGSGNLVEGNYIGTNAAGAAAIGNAIGIIIDNAVNNTIGGSSAGARNVISGNSSIGVVVANSGATGNLVQGNYIGTDAAGTAAIANLMGVRIQSGASNNTIGGTAAGAGNIIAFNTLNGLTLADTTAATNTARRNSFFSNGGLAIDAGSDGVTLNTPGNNLNFPVLTGVRTGVGVIEVEGFARPGKTIEFYVNDSNAAGFGEGKTYLSTGVEGSPADTDTTSGNYGPGAVNGTVVGSDSANRFHFTIPVPANFVPGAKVTAVSIGSISEFGAAANADLAQVYGAPVVDAGPDVTILVGQTFSGRASFSDIDSDFWPTAEVNYGDGSGWQTLTLDPPTFSQQNGDGFTTAATVGFALSHRYSDPGSFAAMVRVTDDSGVTGTDAFLIDVTNAPPIIDNSHIVVAPQRLAEGGTVSVNGTFSDASVGDSHTVRIIWGDGSQSYALVNETARTFSSNHVYLDDNLPNTASDVYPLQAIITDNSGATSSSIYGLFFVQVDNVQPTGLTITTSNTTINEGSSITLDGSFVDPGIQDSHRVSINWGDGSAPQIVSPSPGVTSFAGISHQYLNNPTSPATAHTISVQVTDDDEPLGPVTATRSITVNNVTPSNVIVSPSLTDINENGTIALAGSFADPGTLDGHNVVINWGDGSGNKILNLAPGVTSFTGISHQFLDNPTGYPNGAFTISVSVADTDQPTLLTTGTSAVTVRNIAPIVASMTLSQTTILEDGSVTVMGSYVDVGTLDRHTVAINWGDGTTTNAAVDSTTRAFTATHRYLDDNPTGTTSDIYTITATVTDDDTGSVSASRTLTVNNVAPTVRILPGPKGTSSLIHLVSEVKDPGTQDTFTYYWTVTPLGGGSVINGTAADISFATAFNSSYSVTLAVTDDDGSTTTSSVRLEVLTDAADTYVPTSVPSGVTSLMVFGLAGMDVIDGSALSIPLVLDGGADADVLTGGSADDTIDLHQGNDSGFGRGGNDKYRLTPNSTLTVEDGIGNNTLDFGSSSFGITFDLSLDAGQLQDVKPLTPGLHYVSIDDLGTGQFGTLVGTGDADDLTAASNSAVFGGSGADMLRVKSGTLNAMLSGGADADQLLATGNGIANIDFRGDDGADTLINNGTAVAGIVFTGGSDGDLLQNNGSVTVIDFHGDDGADALTNIGSVATINFGGGSDGDQLQNSGTVATRIDFHGDDGADTLTNTGSVATITFAGGSDGDVLLTNAGSVATAIDFHGDDGADTLLNTGSVATITFTGGSDGDVLQNSGTNGATVIDFHGDDGADTLLNNGSVATITFTGGSDGDQLQNSGSVATLIDFHGDDGADTLLNNGSVATITFTGGSDGDALQNSGSVATRIDFHGDDGADTLLNTGSVATITFTGGSDGDVLQNNGTNVATIIDFHGDDGADTLLNNGSVATITFTGGSDGDVLQNSGTNAATIIDFHGDDGADTLTNLGTAATITFAGGSDGDLLQTSTGSAATVIDFRGDDGADTLLNNGTVATITFTGGSDGDLLQNSGTNAATIIDFHGDDGADTLTNLGTVATITFAGGSDGDLLQTSTGSAATVIDFHGDDGADTLLNNGSVATITFTGGSDADRFRNSASGVNTLTFTGDDGADLFVNTGNAVTKIDFHGDDGADILLNTGTGVTKIDFTGDDGADILQNTGAAATIIFTGGSDGDQLLNNGSGVTTIDFHGDDGADVFVNNGNAASIITFTGGADGDAFQNNASLVGRIDFRGDDGADVFHNNGAGVANITFTGGADGDYLQNTGANVARIDFHGDDGADLLVSTGANVAAIDFHGDDGADTLLNTGAGVANISFTGGSDGDLLQNNGTGVTAIDFHGDDGADTLTNIGSIGTITFTGGSDGDLLQTSTGSAATVIDFHGDDGADTLLNNGSVATITFTGGADGDLLQNSGSVATVIDFHGDDGADTLVNLGTGVANITFTGGSDNDAFWNFGAGLGNATFHGDDGADSMVNNGAVVSAIDFHGDDGADTLTNAGSAAAITFTGGSDGDLLQNSGSVATIIDFHGDDGADTLTNAGSAATITFTGGSDGDLLQNSGTNPATVIDFHGDDGADTLLNTGSVATLTFAGGSDGDLLQNSGTNAATVIDFHGDDGADTLLNNGNVATITFTGGADGDLYVERAQTAHATFNGGLGDDRVLLSGSGNMTLVGGAGSDRYSFAGAPQGAVTVQDDFQLADQSIDTLDFAGYSASGVSVDLSRTTTQAIASGLSLTLSSNLGIENVVGTAFADTLIGNDRNNVLTGAALRDDRVTAGAGWDGVTQWVYLDFDFSTEAGEHVYTQAERDAIQTRITTDYRGPDALNPWFHVTLTQNLNDIPSVLRNAEQYATLYFNRTPGFNRPGGEASELDFRNTNLGGTASIQVNGLTGGANQPATTSANIVALAAKIGAHELAHLMGVRHSDAFGPIGYGLHAPPGNDTFKPSFGGPEGAFETLSHLIGSPATIGSDRFNDLNDLYFGEREAVKLSFAERGAVAAEQSGSHDGIASAQALTLASLTVPTTVEGLHAGSSFGVAALAVTGHIGLSGAHSESDFYTFTGRKGDVISIEVLSIGLAQSGATIDSILRVYDATGQLVPYFGGAAANDDQFEPTDSLLLDVLLPADGAYYIEVDTFARDPNDPVYDPTNPTSPLNPANIESVLNPLNPNYDADRLAEFLDARDDTDTGDYELFLYRFGSANASDTGDNVQGGPGDDTIQGGMGGDGMQGGPGVDVIDPGDGSTPVPTPADRIVNEGAPVALALVTSGTPTINWQVAASNGQSIANGSGTSFTFVPNDNGTYSVSYNILGSQGDTSSDSVVVTVLNVAPTVTVGGNEELFSTTLSRSGSFSDPGADTWTATVNYGDGTGTQSLSLNADKTFALNHVYSGLGTFPVTVTVNDSTATGSASFQVLLSNLPAAIDAGPNQTANEGATISLTGATFSNPYSTGTHTATINWGDGTAVVAASVGQSASGGGVTGTLSGSHRYADNGAYTVTVTVTTPLGATSSDSFMVTVNNVAPTLAALTGPTIVIPGQPLVYSSAFTDPGFNNSLNSGGEVVETFTGSVNWGDGSSSAATVTWATGSPGVLSTGSASKGHTYSTPGNYTITLTLNDDDSGSATRTLAVNVTESAYLLATSGSEVLSVSGNGRVVMPGVIEVNSTSSTAIKASGNAQISATQIHVLGGYSSSGNAIISPTPTTGGTAVADPLASLTGPTVSGSIGSVNLSGNTLLTISPGRFSQIKLSGNAKLTMLPGVYVILGGGMSVTGNASVTGSRVMIYNAGSNYPAAGGSFGGIAVTGTGTINLTPPAVDEPYAGILFFQARNNSRALALSGNGLLGIHGTIYAPVAQLALSGSAELKASLVLQSVTVSGNASSTLMLEGDVGVVDLAKTLLGADQWIYVDNSDAAFPVDALARIDAAIAGLNALLGSHGVFVTLVNSPNDANLVIDAEETTPLGGVAEGVLGYFAETEGLPEITLVQGWNWFHGTDPAGIGQNQFDFQTIVTHEIGHALGLGHSADASLVMYGELNVGIVKRTVTEADLSISDSDGGGDPLRAAGNYHDLTHLSLPKRGPLVDARRAPTTSVMPTLALSEHDLMKYYVPGQYFDRLRMGTFGGFGSTIIPPNTGIRDMDRRGVGLTSPNGANQFTRKVARDVGADILSADVTSHYNLSGLHLGLSEWLSGDMRMRPHHLQYRWLH